jgi:hypothetical protein
LGQDFPGGFLVFCAKKWLQSYGISFRRYAGQRGTFRLIVRSVSLWGTGGLTAAGDHMNSKTNVPATPAPIQGQIYAWEARDFAVILGLFQFKKLIVSVL